MKKMASFLGLLAIFNLVAVGGLCAYLMGTGRLDAVKARAIADLLRHQGAPANLREKLADVLDPPAAATQPGAATQTASTAPAEAPGAASAQERIDFAQQAMEQERLQLATEAQDLQHRQELLEREQATFAQKVDSLEKEKKDFAAQVAATSGKA